MQISERMWTLWPQLIQCFHEWAIDYFENILVPLDNFISRGTDTFLSSQNPNYLQQARPCRPWLCPQPCNLFSSAQVPWAWMCYRLSTGVQ